MENGSQNYPFEETQFWTAHRQVTTHAPDGTEIYVDEGICELLETLWGLGYETAFSCSGGEETNPSKQLKGKIHKGYIYFETPAMAGRFMETAAKVLPVRRYAYSIETAGGLQGQVVRFHDKMIPLFLAVFQREETMLPAYSHQGT